jgi:hypothetical protein
LCSFPFSLSRSYDVFSRMLKDMIRKQTLHYIFDILEGCVDIWEEHSDVIGSQACSNPDGDVGQICRAGTRNGATHLDDTRAAAASSSRVKGTTGGLRRCKQLGDGGAGRSISIGPDVLAEGTGREVGASAGAGEGGGGSCVWVGSGEGE